jgi:hypothetical protein
MHFEILPGMYYGKARETTFSVQLTEKLLLLCPNATLFSQHEPYGGSQIKPNNRKS